MIPSIEYHPLRIALTMYACLWAIVSTRVVAQQIPSGDIAKKLDTSIKIATTTPDLREIAATLRQSTNTAIIVDRRIDPARIVKSEAPTAPDNSLGDTLTVLNVGPDFRKAIDQVSQLSGAQWATDGFVVFIAPNDVALRTAAFSIEQWDALRTDNRSKSLGLIEARDVSWNELATPNEILQDIATQWKLDASSINLSHDHWPATDLGKVPVTSALAAVAMGFDLVIEIDIDRMTLRALPLPTSLIAKRSYPTQKFGQREKDRVRKASSVSDVLFQPTADGVSIITDAKGHLEAAYLVAASQASIASGSKPRTQTPPSTVAPKYTLRLVEQGGKALAYLAQTAEIKIRIAPSAVTLLEQRIELEAKDRTIDELIRMVAEQAGVTVTQDGDTLVFSGP